MTDCFLIRLFNKMLDAMCAANTTATLLPLLLVAFEAVVVKAATMQV